MNNDRITALEEQLAVIQAEIEKLKAEEQSKEVKPWRALPGGTYYSINWIGEIAIQKDVRSGIGPLQYMCGNYYRTGALAERDAKELAMRGRIRQLRDALCEGYKFVPQERNFYVFFSHIDKCFHTEWDADADYIGTIWFDTQEHAQQACDILNAEMRKESGGKL